MHITMPSDVITIKILVPNVTKFEIDIPVITPDIEPPEVTTPNNLYLAYY